MSQSIEQTNTRYLAYADGVRVVAIIAVIALHSAAVGVSQFGHMSAANWWVFNTIDSSCRWAVPVFVILSGALLLDGTRQETAWQFYQRRLDRVALPTVVWVAFYFFWMKFFLGVSVDAQYVCTQLWNGVTDNPMYFMFIILGLYVVTPLLRPFLRHSPQWIVGICLMALFVAESSGWFFEHVSMNVFTRFLPYISFFVLGHLLRNMPIKLGFASVAALLYLGASAVITWQTGELVHQWGIDDPRALALYDHFHVLVIVQSVAMFLLLQNVLTHVASNPRIARRVRILGGASFGVYLTHFAALTFIKSQTATLFHTHPLAAVTVEVCAVFVFCTLIVLAVQKIPLVRRVVS